MENSEQIIDEIDAVLKKSGFGIDEYTLGDKGTMSLTIIPNILRMPKRMMRRTYSVKWIQDVLSLEADDIIADFNSLFARRQEEARYVKGSPNNKGDKYVGIYLENLIVIGR